MAISINSATQSQSQVAVQPAPARQPVAAQPHARGPIQPAATVNISAAAQALQEATESQAQTAREANSGDSQAKRLLAKEAAAK